MNPELQSWARDLTDRLRVAMANDFRRLTDGLAHDGVAGVGAYTDADASNVVVAINTEANLNALIERRPQYRNYFRWSIGEWDRLSFEELSDDALQPINDELAVRADALGKAGAALDEFRAAVWAAVVDALAGLAEDGDFDELGVAVRVFEPIDAGVSESQIRDWIAQLNDADSVTAYEAWAANPSS